MSGFSAPTGRCARRAVLRGRRTRPRHAGAITSAPALQAEFLDTIAAIERPLAEAIAARTDGQGELGPEVLAAAVSGAARVAAERWLQPEPDVRFSVMLNEALTWIVPALRVPMPGRPG